MTMHLRIAAGVCVVTAGLVIGSAHGAIAAADDSGGSDTGSQSSDSKNSDSKSSDSKNNDSKNSDSKNSESKNSDSNSGEGQSADGPTRAAGSGREPIGRITDNLRTALQTTAKNAVQGVTTTLNAVAEPGQRQSSITEPPKTTVASESGALTSPSVASEPSVVTSPTVAPQPSVVTPPTVAVAPLFDLTAEVLVPVSNVVVAVTNSVATAPVLVASLPRSVTPVSDVITSLQEMLTSIVDAGTQFTQLPADLYGLLGVAAGGPGATMGAAADRVGPWATADAPMPALMAGASQQLPFPNLVWFAGVPTPDESARPATLLDIRTAGTNGDGTSATTPSAPQSDGSSVLSTVKRVIGAIVASVSLMALLAMAVPGIGGLLGVWAAGIRIGYRQARAASALPTTAVMRFAASGPIGIVRSGSQVSVRPRAGRSGSSSVQLLDHAV